MLASHSVKFTSKLLFSKNTSTVRAIQACSFRSPFVHLSPNQNSFLNVLNNQSASFSKSIVFCNEEKKQQQTQQQEEPKEEQQNTDQQQQTGSEDTTKKSYFKKLLSPANLILPAVFGIILYNFAKYDVRQKKREAELDRQASNKAVKAVGAPKLGGAFTLVNTKGEVITDSEFRGKFMFMYFGFTNCPDVCPTEMKKMTKALQMLEKQHPELADKIVPIFVSCDPPRDSCTAVAEYLQDYHPNFIGLTGTPDQISRVCKKYRVYYNAPDYKEGKQDYLVDHSIFIYLMDPYGHLAEYFAQNTTADKVYERVLASIQDYKWD